MIAELVKKLSGKKKQSFYNEAVRCTCGCSPDSKDLAECLYISADASPDNKESLIEIWDWRGESAKSTFLYLNKKGITDLITILEKANANLKDEEK